MISDKPSRDGCNAGWVCFHDEQGRELWSADASREGKRWIVHAQSVGAAFVAIEPQTRHVVSTSH